MPDISKLNRACELLLAVKFILKCGERQHGNARYVFEGKLDICMPDRVIKHDLGCGSGRDLRGGMSAGQIRRNMFRAIIRHSQLVQALGGRSNIHQGRSCLPVPRHQLVHALVSARTHGRAEGA